ncbi:unnamed protein product [Auanema sp. JU1783]|nr:unnamed protein product [Auanema sp. JU1783]
MRFFIILFYSFLLLTANAQQNRENFIKRVVNLDVKILTRPQISKFLTCMCPHVAECPDMMAFGSACISCLSDNFGDIMESAFGMVAKLETCMITGLSSTMIVSAKVASLLQPELTKIYNPMCKKVETARKNKKTQIQQCNVGIGHLLSEVKRKFIDNICMQIKDKCSDKEFKCLLKEGKAVIDLNTYNCASAKASILG